MRWNRYNFVQTYIVTVVLIACGGCASLLSDNEQLVEIKTNCGSIVNQYYCQARNDKGTWNFVTPARIKIKKSNKDLEISCQPGLFAGISATATSQPNIPMYSNIIIGGGIGAVVDYRNGKGFIYPTEINMEAPICQYLK